MRPLVHARPVDRITDELRKKLLNQHYSGVYLPAERELAAELGVSRLTLRASLARLEAEGLVRAEQGNGVRILDVWAHASLSVLAHVDISRDRELFASLLALRRTIASEAIAQACARASEHDIAEMHALIALQAAETDSNAYRDRDLAISRHLLVCAHSPALLLLFNSLAHIYGAQPNVSAALLRDRAQSLAGYQAVAALLSAREANVAREQLRQALEHADAKIIESLPQRKRAHAIMRSAVK